MTVFLEHPVLGPSHCSATGAELPRQECSLEGKSFVTAYWKARRNQQALARRQSLETGVDGVKGRQFTTEEGNSDKGGQMDSPAVGTFPPLLVNFPSNLLKD